MKYVLAVFSLVALMGCSSSQTTANNNNNNAGGAANNSIIQLQAPVITDQEFPDGLPQQNSNYGKDVAYQTQLKQTGTAAVKALTRPATTTAK